MKRLILASILLTVAAFSHADIWRGESVYTLYFMSSEPTPWTDPDPVLSGIYPALLVYQVDNENQIAMIKDGLSVRIIGGLYSVHAYNGCLDSASPSYNVQDEYTFHATAGTNVNIIADVPDANVCPAGTSQAPPCPLNPEIAICPGTDSPDMMNPDCVGTDGITYVDNWPCSDLSLGTTCCQILYTIPDTGTYIIAINPQRIWIDPAATGCYRLSIKSDVILTNWSYWYARGDTF